MDTDDPSEIISRLSGPRWRETVRAVSEGEEWLRAAAPGDPRGDQVAASIAAVAEHRKWEVRHAVVQVSGRLPHKAFDAVVARCRTDENLRVRQAAERASLRRRDWQAATMYGSQHEARINAVLDSVEQRLGPQGRDLARRAGNELANTFARELYHEVVRLLTPLTLSVERLEERLVDETASRLELQREAKKIHSRVTRIEEVMGAMRAYAAMPDLTFGVEQLDSVVREAVSLVTDARLGQDMPAFHVDVPPGLEAEVARTRIVQALRNLLANAVESYDGLDLAKPITVTAEAQLGGVRVVLKDAGCGMSADVLNDAKVLFVTSKSYGTGFGLPLSIKIIETEHNGRLSLESEEGVGTTVTLELPAKNARGR